MTLSLRATISAFAALSVAVVAAVTLTIAISTSLEALRAIGKRHAASLATNANALVESRFQQGSDAVSGIARLGTSARWNHPSEDNTTLAGFAASLKQSFFHEPQALRSIIIFFSDNTQLGLSLLSSGYCVETIFYASPYGTTFPNTALQADQVVRTLPDLAPTNTTDEEVQWPVFRVRDFMWDAVILPFVANGSTTRGVAAPGNNGTLEISVMMMGPVYRFGDAHSPPNAFAMIVATFDVIELSAFLHALPTTPGAVSFIYDEQGILIGSSIFETLTFVGAAVPAPNDGRGIPAGCVPTVRLAAGEQPMMICRSNITSYGYAPLQQLASSRPDLTHPTAASVVDYVTLAGDKYFVATVVVPLAFPGMPLWVMLLLPEADVLGDVVTGRNTAIGVTCGLFVLVAIVLFVLVSLLLAPLSRIAERMQAAANFDDDGELDEPSSMAEVRVLQQAYFEMNDELNRIRSFVPQTVLMAKRAEAQGIDLDLEFEETPTNGDDTRSNRSVAKSRARSGSVWDDRASAGGSAGGRGAAADKSSGGGGGHAAVVGVLGIRTCSATVMLGNLSGLHAAAAVASTEQLAAGIHDAVTVFGGAVGSRGGVLSFHGDRFFASFNAAAPCASHARRAVEAALEIGEGIAAVGLKLPAYVTVATGSCTVGGFGSESVKAMCVIGPAVAQAAAMERVGREFNCRVLASQRTIADVSTLVDYRYVDLVRLQSRDGSLKPALVAEVTKRERAMHADRSGSGAEGEWLYVVGDGHGGVAAAARNKVFEELAHGDPAKAAALYAALQDDGHVEPGRRCDGLERALYGAAVSV